MRTYPCVVSVYGARSAVFVRTGRVLSITSQAILSFFEGFHRHRNFVVSTRSSLVWYRVGMNVSLLTTNRTNKYAHVLTCHGHVWHLLYIKITFFKICAVIWPHPVVGIKGWYKNAKYVEHVTTVHLFKTVFKGPSAQNKWYRYNSTYT